MGGRIGQVPRVNRPPPPTRSVHQCLLTPRDIRPRTSDFLRYKAIPAAPTLHSQPLRPYFQVLRQQTPLFTRRRPFATIYTSNFGSEFQVSPSSNPTAGHLARSAETTVRPPLRCSEPRVLDGGDTSASNSRLQHSPWYIRLPVGSSSRQDVLLAKVSEPQHPTPHHPRG